MRTIYAAFLVLILLTATPYVWCKEQPCKIPMPDWMTGICPAMPVEELLKSRVRIKSGTTVLDCSDYRRSMILCKWFNDPNNPKKIDVNRPFPEYTYHLKEKSENPLFDTVHYYFSSPQLKRIEVRGMVNTLLEIKNYPKHRDRLIAEAIHTWGKPDVVGSGKEYIGGGHSFGMGWINRNGITIGLSLPVSVEMHYNLWWYITGLGAETILSLTIADPRASYTPKTKEEKGETERLLKSIDYYETVEQALKEKDQNLAVRQKELLKK